MNAALVGLVTGSNRGIGFEISRQLAFKGVELLMTGRNESSVVEAAKQIRNEIGEKVKISTSTLDVSKLESINLLINKVKTEYQNRNLILVNNAGIYIDGWTQEVFDSSMRTNCYGPASLTLQLLPLMKEKKWGRIINVSSGYGKIRYSSKYQNEIEKILHSAKSNDFLLTSPPLLKFENNKNLDSEFKITYKISKCLLNTFSRILATELKSEGLDKFIFINAMGKKTEKKRIILLILY